MGYINKTYLGKQFFIHLNQFAHILVCGLVIACISRQGLMRKETVDTNILETSRNGDSKIFYSNRIATRPSTKIPFPMTKHVPR